jgi:hypothetical protein
MDDGGQIDARGDLSGLYEKTCDILQNIGL